MVNVVKALSTAQGGAWGRIDSVLNAHTPCSNPQGGSSGRRDMVLNPHAPPFEVEHVVWALSTESQRLLIHPSSFTEGLFMHDICHTLHPTISKVQHRLQQ